MDILFELLAALFKGLFGDQEPPAQLGPRGRGADQATGPYADQGDSGQPKTLAELLEEARASLQEAEAPPPRAPAPQPPAPTPPPSPPPPRPAVQASPPPAASRAKPAAAAPRPDFVRQLSPAAASRSKPAPAAPGPATQPPMQVRQIGGRDKPAPIAVMAQMGSVAHIVTPVAQAPSLAASRDASHGPLEVTSETAGKIQSWLAALQSPRPEEKIRLGLEAITALAVFGPPRSKQPHRYGSAG